MPNKRWKTEQVSIDCSIHPVWTHLSSEHWHFKILSSVDREIKMRFSAHTNRKISIGQTQFAFERENASSISSWSFLINLRTSEKAKLFEHFYSIPIHEFCQDGIDDVALAEETPVLHKRQHFLWKRNGAKSIFYAQRWRSSREY